MRIGEVATACGLPARTLRFYERKGLLPEPDREVNGYRRYDSAVVERVGFIRNAQMSGLTLAEIRGVLDIRDCGSAPCGHVTDLLTAKHREIREQIEQLRALEADLRSLIDRSAQLDPADCGSVEICHILQLTASGKDLEDQ